MVEIDSLENFIWGIAILAPGFLFMFGRSRFLTGRMPSVAASVFEYLMISSVYFALCYPLFVYLELGSYLAALALLFGLPLASGLIAGFATQKRLFRWLGNKLGLNPVHFSPTAWDYIFSDRSGYSWVVVNLNSGGRYFGVFGPSSLASSDLSSQDIYLEEIRNETFDPIEQNGRKRGVWISQHDIRSIEIVED